MKSDTQSGVVKTCVFSAMHLMLNVMTVVHAFMKMMDTHVKKSMMNLLLTMYTVTHTNHVLYFLAIPSITLVLS